MPHRVCVLCESPSYPLSICDVCAVPKLPGNVSSTDHTEVETDDSLPLLNEG